MVKYFREYTQVHMVKWWNTLVDISSSKNGKMVKRLYLPSSSLSFTYHFENGDQVSFLTTSADASAVYRRCRVDHLIVPRADPTPFDAVYPASFYWYISSLYSFRHLHHRVGVVPICNLLTLVIFDVRILAIYYIILRSNLIN